MSEIASFRKKLWFTFDIFISSYFVFCIQVFLLRCIFLRSSFKSSVRTDQDSRVAELLQQLIDTEKSELEYKSKLWNLEKNEKQLQIKVKKLTLIIWFLSWW